MNTLLLPFACLVLLFTVPAQAQVPPPATTAPAPTIILIIKEYRVPPSVFASTNPKDEPATQGGLPCRGVTFTDGRFAMYSRASQTLILKATAEEHAKVVKEIQRLLRGGNNAKQK